MLHKTIQRWLAKATPESESSSRAIVTLAPIVLVVSAGMLSVSSMYQQYIFTSKEIQGTYDIEYLIHLRTALKGTRGLRQFPEGHINKNVKLHWDYFHEGEIKTREIHGEKHPHHNHDEDDEHDHEASEQKSLSILEENRKDVTSSLSHPEWLGIKRRYGFHLGDVKLDLVRAPSSKANLDYEADFKLYTDRLDELNEYFALVADKSNLILDPEIDTYYLMSLTSSTQPTLIDLIAESRGRRVVLDTRTDKLSDLKAKERSSKLVDLKNLIDYNLNSLNRTINILSFSSPSAYADLEIDRLQLIDKIDGFKTSLLAESKNDKQVAVARWNQATELIAFLQNIQNNGITILRVKLEERRQKIAIQIALVAALLLSGSFLIYFINNRLFGKLSRALVDIKELANTDSLTQLLSRRSLPHLYTKAVDDCIKAGGLGVCLLDVDYFKAFNDTYGHAQGDDALVTISALLKGSLLRDTDYAFRYGGEEFLLVFAASELNKMDYFLQSIRRGVENLKIPHQASAVNDHITISMGAVFIPESIMPIDSEIAILQADRELYKVKNNSRNAVSVVTLSTQMDLALREELEAKRDRRNTNQNHRLPSARSKE